MEVFVGAGFRMGNILGMNHHAQPHHYHRRGRGRGRKLQVLGFGLLTLLIIAIVTGLIFLLNSKALVAPN